MLGRKSHSTYFKLWAHLTFFILKSLYFKPFVGLITNHLIVI